MRLAPRQQVQMVLAVIVLLARRRAILHYSHVSHTFQNAERMRHLRMNPWPFHKPPHSASFLRHPLASGRATICGRATKQEPESPQDQSPLASLRGGVYPLAFREKHNSATTFKASRY